MTGIKLIAVSLMIGLLIGAALGMYYGIYITIDRAMKIIPIFTNITINEQAVYDALFRYHNNIGQLRCTSTLQLKE